MEPEPSLQGARLKLQRARAHRLALSEAWASWYSSVRGFEQSPPDAEGWVHCRWTGGVENPPPEMGLFWGDHLYNARAALDYLIWQLVLLDRGKPTRSNAWPVVRSPEDWTKARRARLSGLSEDHVELVRGMQPFLQPARPLPAALDLLDELNNMNKHRLPQSAVVELRQFDPVFTFDQPSDQPRRWRMRWPRVIRVEPGQPFLSVRMDPHVPFRVDVPARVTIALSMSPSPATDPLPDFAAAVEEVLSAFESAFPG